MEQFKEKVILDKSKSTQDGPTCSFRNRILFNLKNHSMVQESLINSIVVTKNCGIVDLAKILGITVTKLQLVIDGLGILGDKESEALVNLFYIVSDR